MSECGVRYEGTPFLCGREKGHDGMHSRAHEGGAMAWHTREEMKRIAESDRRTHDHVSGNEGAATESPQDPLCAKVHPALGFSCQRLALHTGRHMARTELGEITWLVGGKADTSAPPGVWKIWPALSHQRPDSRPECPEPTPSDHYAFTYNGLRVDPYRVAEIYGIEDVRQFHAIKKLLRAGRGAKSLRQDVEEARWTLSRWLEMMDEER